MQSAVAVVDASVVVAAVLGPKSSAHAVMRALFSRRFTGVASTEILLEYRYALRSARVRKVLEQRQIPQATVDRFLDDLSAILLRVQPWSISFSCPDPDDEKYITCALAAQADYVVSLDPHLLNMVEFASTRVVTPEGFLRALADEEGSS